MVFAFWLEGADASGLLDEYSDMDIWFDVQNSHEDEVFQQTEEVLKSLAPLDFVYEAERPHPQIRYKIFHLRDTPDFLFLDINIQSHSRKFEFIKGLKGEEARIIFDKNGTVKFRDLDVAEREKTHKNRIHHLKNIFAQQARIIKMIKRSQFIDAFNFYYKFVLLPLGELLRIRFAPQNQFFLKYISKDLPQEIAKKYEALYKVNSFGGMLKKIKIANELFAETLREME